MRQHEAAGPPERPGLNRRFNCGLSKLLVLLHNTLLAYLTGNTAVRFLDACIPCAQ